MKSTKVSRLAGLQFLPLSTFQGQPKFSIADIGCGEGESTKALGKAFPEAKIVGIDIDQEAITYAKNHTTAINISFDCK